MNITEMAPELMGCLRTKLGQAAQAKPRMEAAAVAPIQIAEVAPAQIAAPGQNVPVPTTIEDTQND
jgi:hypothetical protein